MNEMGTNNYPYWAEVRGYVEEWFHKHGGQPMPHDEALRLLGNPPDIKELCDDGYHYVRQRTDKDVTTNCVYTFKDASLMDELNSELVDGGSSLASYEEYRAYIDADEDRKQIEARRLEFNHPIPKVLWAWEFIGTLEEWLNYSNVNELTPHVYQAFMDAIETFRLHGCKGWLEDAEFLKQYIIPIPSNVFDKNVSSNINDE